MSRFLMGLVGDNLAVGDSLFGRISLLNPPAAVIWLTLMQGPCAEADLAALFDGAGADRQTTGAAIVQSLRRFEALGWVEKDVDGAWRTIDAPDGSARALPLWTPTDADQREDEGETLRWTRQTKISNARVQLDLLAEAGADRPEFARMAGFLGGLAQGNGAPCDARVAMAFSPKGIEVIDAGLCAFFDDIAAASGVFLKRAIGHAHPDAIAFTTLHAGAVCKAGGAILLPAVTGLGKTTLTAYLVARGWRYGGDDVVGIGRFDMQDTIHLLPFPTALGIKDGSVEILRPHFPALDDARTISYGSKSVRYAPCEDKLAPMTGDWRTVRALVFPAYESNAALQLDALAAPDALRMILEAGWGDGVELDPPGFDLLLDAVNILPAYTMRYSSLEAASAALDALV